MNECINERTNERINIFIYNVCPCDIFNTDDRLARVILQVHVYLKMRSSLRYQYYAYHLLFSYMCVYLKIVNA